jgi:hypothetical protein
MTILFIVVGAPILSAIFLLGLFKLEKAASDESYL